jgi:peptidoglycan glycosyltransferase
VESLRSAEGQTVGTTFAQSMTRATDAGTASTVNGIMQKVVSGGSGYRASIPGVKVAGKTGTAEVGKGKPTNAWFIAFAPANNPTVAMAIMIEGGGVGGQVAAPAARPVLQTALNAQRGK